MLAMPVLRISLLPEMSEDKVKELLIALIMAVMEVDVAIEGEEDIFVLFPSDVMRHGIGAYILVEYDDVMKYNDRHISFASMLTTALADIVSEYFPSAFIQVSLRSSDGIAYVWNKRMGREIERYVLRP